MSALGHVWTAPWQELSDIPAALVGCGHVSGLFVRQLKPLAIMLCADRVPIVNTHFKDAMTQTGSPDPRNDLVCITSSCPRQLVYSRCQQRLWFCVSLTTNHDCPGHPCDLVGECNCRHLCRSAIDYSGEPRSFGAVRSRVANDSHGAGDEEPSQIAIALLGDAAEPLLAAGGVRGGHQADPSRQTAPRADLSKGQWRRSGQCRGSARAAGSVHMIGAKHGCACRWMRPLR